MSAIKRGGNQQLVSFDLHLPETEAAMQATAHLDQVSSYDLAWASTVAKRSWQQLHETLVAEGKAQWFDELQPFVAGAEQAHFATETSFAHCQNFAAAGLSRPFVATRPTENGFGSGVRCKNFTRFPKL